MSQAPAARRRRPPHTRLRHAQHGRNREVVKQSKTTARTLFRTMCGNVFWGFRGFAYIRQSRAMARLHNNMNVAC